jgi:hypothetical protein
VPRRGTFRVRYFSATAMADFRAATLLFGDGECFGWTTREFGAEHGLTQWLRFD